MVTIYDAIYIKLSLAKLTYSYMIFSPQFCSYTWKIYANKMLNMGCMYSFWKQLNKGQKLAKQRYIEMFYNLLFKNLVPFYYLYCLT